MVNRALVFINTNNVTDEWMNNEVSKANTFMDGLINWGWERRNIKFLAPVHDMNTRDPDDEPTRANFNAELDHLRNVQDSEYVAVYITDYMPCTDQEDGSGNPLELLMHFSDGTTMEPNELKSKLDFIQHEAGQRYLNVIFSGQGCDRMAREVSSLQRQTMASHDPRYHNDPQTAPYGMVFTTPKSDEFDIGCQMPSVPANDFMQAFTKEKNRCKTEYENQYPVMILE